ncbi:hypothetical protein BS50DRAFT_37479 [Corynespora cassiicola Philippines]|uniref:C2H2-type domain-containing protein n=1 Tax=Corynespora cassiicola Philippines TaxID=1448308 RepID=A0A2T2PC87_CORCC|nr:hypothetical protein BS50DRAFT_37479 [Corynespora cassiicola Philippines]
MNESPQDGSSHINQNSINPTKMPSDQGKDQDLRLQCSHCAMVFDKEYLLRKHIHRRHTPRYSCSMCNQKPFGLRADLNRHISSRHPDTSSKTLHQCPACGKSFPRKDNLLRHVNKLHK